MHILLFVFILRTKRNNIVVRCCSCHIWSHFFCHFVSTLVVKSIILCCSVYFRPIFRLFYAFWEIFIPSNVIFELNSAQVKGMHHITGQWIRHISSSLANGDYGFQIVVVFRTFDRIHLPFSFYLFSLLIFQILILHSVSTMCWYFDQSQRKVEKTHIELGSFNVIYCMPSRTFGLFNDKLISYTSDFCRFFFLRYLTVLHNAQSE